MVEERKFATYSDPAPLRHYSPPIRRAAPAVVEAPAPAPQVRENRELVIHRTHQGLVSDVTGFNAAGEKLTFEFTRDNGRNLEKINIK
jgi:hypothetical protein